MADQAGHSRTPKGTRALQEKAADLERLPRQRRSYRPTSQNESRSRTAQTPSCLRRTTRFNQSRVCTSTRSLHFMSCLNRTLSRSPPCRTPLFPFPSTPRDHALLATFTDLLARALRVGLGPRFGGEYLVYPGDYLRYHAHFTSQVLVRDEPIRPTELVAWGRLGTGTKKAGLICAWDDGKSGDEPVAEGDEGRVEYYSLEWANFG